MTTTGAEVRNNSFETELARAREATSDVQYTEALIHVMQALKVAESESDLLRQSQAHAEHSRILSKLSLFAEAVSAAHRALRLAQDDPVCAARALNALGTANQTLLPPEANISLYESMLKMARQAGDRALEASAVRGLCIAQLISHQMAVKAGAAVDDPIVAGYAGAALDHARESIRLSCLADDKAGAFLGRHLQVGALMKSDDFVAARRESKAMLHVATDLPRPDSYRAITLKLLGQIDHLEGDLAAAEERTAEALALFEARSDLRQKADCLNTLANITEARGDYKAALGWLRRSTDAFERFASASAGAHAAAMEVQEGAQRARALAAAHQARAEHLERSNEELAREAERLTRTSLEDALTGIANRRALDQRLAALFADRRDRRRCSLALLDIDRFKWVNDTFLHTTGDKVLTRLGTVLKECSRQNDFVARFGGEEFAVLFVDVELAEVATACERIRAAVEGANWVDLHRDLAVTVSIGFAHFDEGNEAVEELVKVADGRLFDAKRAGRNRVVGPMLRCQMPTSSVPL